MIDIDALHNRMTALGVQTCTARTAEWNGLATHLLGLLLPGLADPLDEQCLCRAIEQRQALLEEQRNASRISNRGD